VSAQVDFYYDFGSPTAYLAWTQLPALCARNNATLNYKPVLLGGIFKATGNATPVMIKSKGDWLLNDIIRHAAFYNVPYKMNPHFIINSLSMMRGAIWAHNQGVIEDYNRAMFEATWVNGLNTAETDVIAKVAKDANLSSDAMLQAINDSAIKKQLINETESAVDLGVFGAPTMIVGDELHFGQDRLDWVERKLAAMTA
jgi:2-hydroxychromene-2-carboxylate isomerase